MQDLRRAQDLAVALNATILACFGRTAKHRPAPAAITPEASRAARCALRHQASQHAEDLLLLPTLLLAAGWGRPGAFVELGALDGTRYSNTLVLERCFNWTGLLIEGNPANFAQLRRSDRRAAKVHSAVCREGGAVRMSVRGHENAGDADAGDQLVRMHAAAGPNATVAVPCAPLTTLMAAAGLPRADFLSLDVQARHLATARPRPRPRTLAFAASTLAPHPPSLALDARRAPRRRCSPPRGPPTSG